MTNLTRPLLVAAALCWLPDLVAQSDPTPTKTTPTIDRQRTETNPANTDRGSGRSLETSAGNPEGVQHPGSTGIEDNAIGSLVLEPGQLERIKRMDERYAAELNMIGPVPHTDPAYRTMWERRKREIADILTPMQFERWQELNRSLDQPQPLPMPQGSMNDPVVTPMPGTDIDSTNDPMPQIDPEHEPPTPQPLPQ